MVSGRVGYSVVMPIRDEAARLPWSLPALLEATAGDEAEIVLVCNGCTDVSAALARELVGDRARILELPQGGKAAALNAGDAVAKRFPRFDMDADAAVGPGDFARLVRPLLDGAADLVASRCRFDTEACSRVARAIAETWVSLARGRTATFQTVMGLSEGGRSRWSFWLEGPGDDIFVAAMIPLERRRIVDGVWVVTRAPASFRSWVRARARWLRGERALRSMGLSPPRLPGQRAALCHRLARPDTAFGAACFVAARLLGDVRSRSSEAMSAAWRPER